MKTQNKKEKAPSSKKKMVLWGLGLLATGVLTFFGIQYWRKNQEDMPAPDKSTDSNPTTPPPAKKTSSAKKATKPATKSAPTKPSASANTNAKTESKPINAVALGKAIHSSTVARDFSKTLALVKQIKTVVDYSSVSNEFRKYFLNGVRQTLVNGLLTSFNKADQKQAFQKAFAGMGLKFDGKKWSLSGIPNYLITISATKVWKDPQHSVPVPSNMVLGKEIDRRGEHTVFENEGEYFLVESKAIEYYKGK